MSVTCSTNCGAFLNHHEATDQCYKSYDQPEAITATKCPNEDCQKLTGCKWKAVLFAINSPFMMDSQAERIRREGDAADPAVNFKETSAQRKRRKKAKMKSLSQDEMRVSEFINKTLLSLIEKAREAKHLEEVHTALRLTDNNAETRAAAQVDGCGDLFQNLCCEFDEDENKDQHSQNAESVIICKGIKESLLASSIVGRCVCNKENHAGSIKLGNHKFVIPGHSSFLTSSFHHLVAGGYQKLQVSKGYHLIVIDPPWINKSVKRKKSYQMVHESDLKRIPIQDLAGDNCLVCVWITNNERLIQFVKDKLLPHWSVEWIADWIWMKVTKTGEPVFDMNSPHKKPYEKLIIGHIKRPPQESDVVLKNTFQTDIPCSVEESLPIPNNAQVDSNATNSECLRGNSNFEQERLRKNDVIRTHKRQCLPEDFLLVSVPCALHSKKPPLGGVLSKYLPPDPKCLELFARNLTPGWMSWGFEPLRHQHFDYFEQQNMDKSDVMDIHKGRYGCMHN